MPAGSQYSKSMPPLPRPPEEQDVTVRVANLKATQAVMSILKRFAERRSMTGKFGGKCVGVWGMNISVPSHEGMTAGIRQGCHVLVGFDEELRFVAAKDGKKRIPVRLLEPGLKAKLVAVKSNGLIDVADDEEWRNPVRGSSRHTHVPSCRGIILGNQGSIA